MHKSLKILLVHLDQRSMGTIAVVCKLFTGPIGTKLSRNVPWMVLYKVSVFFIPVRYSTWLPGPIICSDWLKFQRSSSLKLMN